jgi:anti-sigma factor RsiW
MSGLPAGCTPFDADLSALIDQELEPLRRAELQTHLDACARCRQRLGALGRVDEGLRELAARPLAADLDERLRRHVVAEHRPARSGRRRGPLRRVRWGRRSALAVTAAAGLALATLWLPRLLWQVPPGGAAPGQAVARLEPPAGKGTVSERGEGASVAQPALSSADELEPPPGVELELALVLEGSSEEEIELALGLQQLADVEAADDLELIEALDLLERLDALDARGQG